MVCEVGHGGSLEGVGRGDTVIVVGAAGPEARGSEAVGLLAVAESLGKALVRVGRADHHEGRLVGDRDLSLGDAGVERTDHAQDLGVGDHGLDVLHALLRVVSAVDRVIEWDELHGEAVIGAAGETRHGECGALLRRQAARRLVAGCRQVTGDIDLALGSGATAATTTRERDERCRDEDSESPSSNHMVPPCVCREARRNPSWRTPPPNRRPLPNLCRGESAPATNAATWGGRTTTPW